MNKSLCALLLMFASSIRFSEATFAFSGLNITTPIVLATISFEALAPGISIIDLNATVLTDSLAGAITPVTEFDGQVTVNGPTAIVPEPSTLALWLWGSLIAGLLAPAHTPRSNLQ